MSININIKTLSLIAICVVITAWIVGYSPTANAQACSASDDQISKINQADSLEALLIGDLNQYLSLQQTLPGKLSSSCRSSLDQREPMRVNCTLQEKNIVLRHYSKVIVAALNEKPSRAISVMLNLEAAVSQQCWLAVNRHIDSRVLNACTAAELDHAASFSGPMFLAAQVALNTGDSTQVLQLTQNLKASLSQYCIRTIQQVAAEPPVEERSPGMPGNVIYHGGGTYSVPGTGACTTAGCIAY